MIGNMCLKILDNNYSLEDAFLLLSDQFAYVNVLQLKIVFNDPYYFNLLDIINELPLLFYIIQSCSSDGKVYKVTIVTNFSVVSVYNKIRQVAKSCCKGKYKVSIFI